MVGPQVQQTPKLVKGKIVEYPSWLEVWLKSESRLKDIPLRADPLCDQHPM